MVNVLRPANPVSDRDCYFSNLSWLFDGAFAYFNWHTIPELVGSDLPFWPLAWAVCDLVTRLLIDIAVNPTNNAGLAVFAAGAMLLGYWILLAIWVIGSSIAGPWIISKSLVAGSSAITTVLGGTVGVAAASAPGMTYRAAALSVGAGAVGGGNGAGGRTSIASASTATACQNFATRPISKSGSKR